MRGHFFEPRATEEGVDPVENRPERGFAQAPHPSSRSLKKNGRRASSTAKPSAESDQATRWDRRLVQWVRRGCGAPSVPSRESTERADFRGTGHWKDEALAATIPDTDC